MLRKNEESLEIERGFIYNVCVARKSFQAGGNKAVQEGEPTSKRIERWDSVKGLLIFLVVFGHILDSVIRQADGGIRVHKAVFLFIYSFHMPLFVFISGLFSKRTIDQARYPKIFSYLVLYFTLNVLLLLEKLAVGKDPGLNLFSDSSVPWYALALFSFHLITIFLKRFSHKYVFILAILVACFAGYDSQIGDFLALSRTIVFYPFFFAGYCLKPEKLERIFAGRDRKVLSWILLFLIMIFILFHVKDLYIARKLLTGRNPYSKLGDLEEWGFLLRLLYYLAAFFMGTLVVMATPVHFPFGKGLATLGKSSLQIYALHRPLVALLFDITPFAAWIFGFRSRYQLVIMGISAAAVILICILPLWRPFLRLIMEIPENRRKPEKRTS